jgi:hypothetical protein
MPASAGPEVEYLTLQGYGNEGGAKATPEQGSP